MGKWNRLPLLSNSHESLRYCWRHSVTWGRKQTDNIKQKLKCSGPQTHARKQTYWSSLKYVKPTKGNWFPTKALGVGNVSTSPLSSSISSKLLVSMSLLSSGTTGATAEVEGRGRKACEMLEKEVKLITLSCPAAAPQHSLFDIQGPFYWSVVTRTVSDGVEGPHVVLEERVSLDFLHTVSPQSHLPQNKEWVNGTVVNKLVSIRQKNMT